jgi:hypothetical protein
MPGSHRIAVRASRESSSHTVASETGFTPHVRPPEVLPRLAVAPVRRSLATKWQKCGYLNLSLLKASLKTLESICQRSCPRARGKLLEKTTKVQWHNC